MITPQQYFFLDDEQQKPIATQCGQAFAPIIGGNLKWRDDGDELHVTGHYQGRPVRLVISVSFGTISVELKAARAFNQVDPTFYIHADFEAQKSAHEMGERDEWDEADGTEQRFFLSPTVYFEGEPSEIPRFQGWLQRLPQEGQAALVQTLSGFDKGSFMVSGDTLRLSCPASVTLNPQSVQFVGYYVNMLFNLAYAMEQVWSG